MSIPFEVVRARSRYRAGQISPKEFVRILREHNYPRPRQPSDDTLQSIAEAAARMVEKKLK